MNRSLSPQMNHSRNNSMSAPLIKAKLSLGHFVSNFFGYFFRCACSLEKTTIEIPTKNRMIHSTNHIFEFTHIKISIAHSCATVYPLTFGTKCLIAQPPMLAFVERIGHRTYKHTTPLPNAPGNP